MRHRKRRHGQSRIVEATLIYRRSWVWEKKWITPLNELIGPESKRAIRAGQGLPRALKKYFCLQNRLYEQLCALADNFKSI